MALSVLILAAGKGTRMNSNSPKVLHHVGNIPMIYYSINLAIKAKAKNIGIVISKDATEIKNFIKSLSINIKLFVQSNQLGTGHAILSAKEFETKSEDLIILYGDCPLITVDTIKKLINTKKKGADLSVLGFLSNNQKEYGRMVVDKNNNLSKIIEYKDADKNEKNIKFCNSGVIISKAKILFSLLNQISNNNSAKEFYLTDIVSLANKQGLIVKSVYCNEAEAQGVNNRQDLSEVELEFQKNKRLEILDNGVTLKDPSSVYFSYDTEIDQDSIVEPNVIFGPGVKIKKNVLIKSFSYLEGCQVETLAQNVKVNHLSYVGDGKIGKNSNIGAGTIFCNYDGSSKHSINISSNTFVGSNVSLVAPLDIGDNVTIGAGSTITEDISDEELAIGRARQINKRKK